MKFAIIKVNTRSNDVIQINEIAIIDVIGVE